MAQYLVAKLHWTQLGWNKMAAIYQAFNTQKRLHISPLHVNDGVPITWEFWRKLTRTMKKIKMQWNQIVL